MTSFDLLKKKLYLYRALRRSLLAYHSKPLSNRILVGTHHKTGTVWMNSVFSAIARTLSLVYLHSEKDDLPSQYDILMDNHSVFAFESFSFPFRGIHLIRDPRDIIISACFYHQKSKEEWLHQPREKFNGLTYQQKINSYQCLDDQFLFEMEHSGGGNIRSMLKWNYAREDFIEVKYEDLIEDIDLQLFHEIFLFLGFPGPAIPVLLNIAYDKSLFSKQAKRSDHVRSGKARQWQQYYKQVHKERFIELFGDALIQLGYEKNNDWAVGG